MAWAQQWLPQERRGLTKQHLLELFANHIVAIRVERFASRDECVAFERQIVSASQQQGLPIATVAGKLGVTHEAHERKDQYFRQARQADHALTSVSLRPVMVNRLLTLLRDSGFHQVEIASEHSSPYFVGVIRRMNTSLVHVDFAPRHRYDEPWLVERVTSQVACVLSITVPSFGGTCVVYNKAWSPADDLWAIASSYGHHRDVVAAVESYHIHPVAGDMHLFNSRNYHMVDIGGEVHARLTMHLFIGLIQESDTLIIWS